MTHEGAAILAALIKVQALKRHNEAWKDSLRYGRPDLDNMFGIRRITANANPFLSDRGVKELAEAFKSDLWLKALDLQNCGITTVGAIHLLDGLKFNAMMHVLDVRLNVDIDRDTLQKIMEQVMINSSGNNTEYEWMDLNQTAVNVAAAAAAAASNNSNSSQSPVKYSSSSAAKVREFTRAKKRRNTNSSFNKKPQFNMSINSMKMKRCKSTGSVVCNKSPAASGVVTGSGGKTSSSSKNGGIPWRTAARAQRYRMSNCVYRRLNENNHPEDEEDAGEFEEDDEDAHLQRIINELDINDKIAPLPSHQHHHQSTANGKTSRINGSYDDLALSER